MSPRQFLYRIKGLKQKVKLHPDKIAWTLSMSTIQNVFLWLLPKYSDIHIELKPLLSECTVSDEALIRQVNKVSSEKRKK